MDLINRIVVNLNEPDGERRWPLFFRCQKKNKFNLRRKYMGMVKEKMIKLIEDQPDDSTPEEILRELAFNQMIESGLSDSDNNRTINNEEIGRRIRTWSK